MELKGKWIWWLVAAVVVLWWMKRGPHLGVMSASPDAYYMPPGGGTLQPGTAPVFAAEQALSNPAPTLYSVPIGATEGPAVAARTGRGHF